jgi:hypothetical protein
MDMNIHGWEKRRENKWFIKIKKEIRDHS